MLIRVKTNVTDGANALPMVICDTNGSISAGDGGRCCGYGRKSKLVCDTAFIGRRTIVDSCVKTLFFVGRADTGFNGTKVSR